MPLREVEIVIRGPHDSGRTTLASLIKEFLEENDYAQVSVQDTTPIARDRKDSFIERFDRNRAHRPVKIRVETIE